MYIDLPREPIGIFFDIYDRELIHPENPVTDAMRVARRVLHEIGGSDVETDIERMPREQATRYYLYATRYITDGCPVRYEP